MPNMSDGTQEFFKYMGAAVHTVQTTVPTGSGLVQEINNPDQSMYESKFSGAIYSYFPNFTGSFLLCKLSTDRNEGSRFIGIQAERGTANSFSFNYVLGENGAPGGADDILDSYKDGSSVSINAVYKFSWYVNRNGTGDAFWTNNNKRAITNIPNRVETFDLNTIEIFTAGTPAGYKLGMLFATLDKNIDDVQMTSLFSAYQNKAPIYLGGGKKMMSGNYRCIYIHNADTLIRNTATDKDFEQLAPATPVNYVHSVERIRIP